jgi:hypothetical protein
MNIYDTQLLDSIITPKTPQMSNAGISPIPYDRGITYPQASDISQFKPYTGDNYYNTSSPELYNNGLTFPQNSGTAGIMPLIQDQNNFPLDYENIQTDPTITAPEKQKLGLSNILPMAMNFIIPGSGLVMRGARGLAGLNRRLRNSDFAQAKTLMDYMDMQKYGGLQGRLDAAARNMAQARGLQKQMNQRDSAQVSYQDAGRGQMPASNSAPKSVGISAANQGSIDPAGAAGKGRKG